MPARSDRGQVEVGLIWIADPQFDLVGDGVADAGGDLYHGLRVRPIEDDAKGDGEAALVVGGFFGLEEVGFQEFLDRLEG